MSVDIGKMYDWLAPEYDRDVYGLLGSGRNAALAQVRAHVKGSDAMQVVDLGAGTGESLVVLRDAFPGAKLAGVDISAEMLAVAAKKTAVRTIVADAAKVAEHFDPATVDLALMHFITTFIDVPGTLRGCREVLRPGGYLSVVSSVMGAFPNLLRDIGLKIASLEEIMAVNPVPAGTDALGDAMRRAGLEVVAIEEVVKPVTFPSAQECLDFGLKSGFFTHIINALGDERIAAAAPALESVFPIDDEYRAVAVLARRPLEA